MMNISQLVAKTQKTMDSVSRKIVIETGRRLVMRSPVGDANLWLTKVNGAYVDFLTYKSAPAGYVGGRFRGNWQHGFNAKPSGEIDVQGKGTAAVSIRAITKGATANGAGVHFISNNLPYAQAIENGHSTQAPQGVVALTVVEFDSIVRQAVSG